MAALPRIRRPRPVASALLAACLGFGVTHAAQAKPPKEEDPNYQQIQYRKAHDAMSAKRWEEARGLLLDLWRRGRTYDVAASLGQVEYWLQNYGAGARYIVFALEHLPPGEDADTVRRLHAGLAELKKHVGAIKIAVDEAGAEVRVDSELVGVSPLASEIYVDPGVHRVEARSPNQPAVEAKVDTAVGESYSLELRTETSRPKADSATNADGPRAPNATVSAAVASQSALPPERSLVPVFVTGGLALACVGAGTALTLMAESDSAKIQNLRGEVGPSGCRNVQSAECTELRDVAQRRDLERNWSYAAFAAGGAAVATGALYLLFPEARKGKTEVSVGLHPKSAFLNVGGRL
jgi:hypothetical protein